ncbi:glycosyltransferase family 2 protein [Butyrivibrio sp. CB08]|uniref:glycosyltransferase family 2 protein n=1 Tax=Butyrivibrio sp. CB08 TaxID=2364879 RepID=UPI0013142741|nr:glycosyltransferase [Butyrivibrio sp. CB08]
MEKVSIIIPVYNRKKYIDLTIESCLSQDYPSLEVIVVDDGSTDGLDQYIKKYDGKIIYAFQCNQGAPSARNTGLRMCSGEYVLFLDAGDYLLEGSIKTLMSYVKDKTDIVLGNMYIEYEGGSRKIQRNVLTKHKYYGDDCCEFCCLAATPPTKVYRKKLLDKNDIEYSDLSIGQDLSFHLKCVLACESIFTIPDCVSSGIQMEGGISRTYTGKIAGIIDAFRDVENYASKNQDHMQRYERLKYVEYYHLFWQLIKVPLIIEKKERKETAHLLVSEFSRLKLEVNGWKYRDVKKFYCFLMIIKMMIELWTSNCFCYFYRKLFSFKQRRNYR